jgi:hypothetical protein
MLYRALADAVLVLHLLFVAFAVAGGLLAFRWRWTALVHLPALAWAAFVEFTGSICPLTPLENALRAAGGQAGYSGGSIPPSSRARCSGRWAPAWSPSTWWCTSCSGATAIVEACSSRRRQAGRPASLCRSSVLSTLP